MLTKNHWQTRIKGSSMTIYPSSQLFFKTPNKSLKFLVKSWKYSFSSQQSAADLNFKHLPLLCIVYTWYLMRQPHRWDWATELSKQQQNWMFVKKTADKSAWLIKACLWWGNFSFYFLPACWWKHQEVRNICTHHKVNFVHNYSYWN